MVSVTFYREKCIGCNGCVEAAPERWRVSRHDGRCNLIKGIEKKGMYSVGVREEEYESNTAAASICPVRAIQVKRI